MTSTRALLIVNRQSRLGERDLEGVQERLGAGGLAVDTAITDSPAEMPQIIRARRKQVDLVVVGGGDGTLRLAAAELVDSGLPLGVLPLGTANDLARTLDIPADPAAACEVIVGGHRHAIDLGWVNGEYFFNVAHIGVGAALRDYLDPDLKRRWGFAAYPRAVIAAMRDHRPFRAEIRSDGDGIRVRVIEIAVGNGRYYGGGAMVAPDAAIDDRRLDLWTIEPMHGWYLLGLAPAILKGRHVRDRRVRHVRCEHAEIRTTRRMAVTADGERIAHTPAVFRVIPAALQVYVPAGGQDAVQD